MPPPPKRILVVGLCCLDHVNYVHQFPLEDTDTRVFERHTRLGGNAANNVTVLQQLNSHTDLFSSLPPKVEELEGLIKQAGINVDRCIRRSEGAEIPISTVIVSNESRTILHYRGNLPELTSQEFIHTFPPLAEEYGWVHFEGRNFNEVQLMMEWVREKREELNSTTPTISLELEKLRPYPYYQNLLLLADVLFVSKDFARQKGFSSAGEAVMGIQQLSKGGGGRTATVICPWGEEGATGASANDGEVVISQAHTPPQVVDTLAAGDCFIGAAIHFFNEGILPLKEVLSKANEIAGRKCGQKGLLNLQI